MLRAQLCLSLPDHMKTLIQFNSNLSWDDLLSCLDKSLPHVIAHSSRSLNLPLIKSESLENADVFWSESNGRQNNRYNRDQPKYTGMQQSNRPNGLNTSGATNRGAARFNGNCNYCQKSGHKAGECRSRLRDLKFSKPNQETNSSYRSILPHQHNSHKASPNTLTLDNGLSQTTSGSSEFPFFAQADATTVEVANLHLDAPIKLLKTPVQIELFEQTPQELSALIDGGSSHSFISPNILTTQQLNIATKSDSQLFMRQNYVIHGATGSAKSSCCVTSVKLKIGRWTGQHSFIISGSVVKHEMILGRDFFKHHNVQIDHGNDVMVIEDVSICINTIRSIGLPRVSSNQIFLKITLSSVRMVHYCNLLIRL